MKMKMKILASTVSLLCFSQVSLAVINSTTTLSGVTHQFQFATDAAAQAAATNPTDAQINALADPDTGATPTTGIGAVTTSTNTDKPNDPPVTLIKTGSKEVVAQTTDANGNVTSVVIATGTVNQLNSIVQAYVSDPAGVAAANPTLIKSATSDPKVAEKIQVATAQAATNIANAKPATSADTAALAAQKSAVQTSNAGLQNALANTEFVTSTVILNGVAKTYVFAGQAAARDAADHPGTYRADFNGATSTTGMVTQNTYKGDTVYLVRTSGTTMAVSRDGVNYVQVSGADVNDLVSRYLNGETALGKPLDAATLAALTAALKNAAATPGVSALLLAALNNSINNLPGTTPAIAASLATAKAAASRQLTALKSALGTAEVARDADAALKRFTDLEDGFNANGTAATTADLNAAAQNVADFLAQAKTSQYQAQNTRGSSAVAGTPARIMNMVADGMFDQAADYGDQFGNKTANVASASSDNGIKTSVGVGLKYGYYDVGGKSSNTVSLPLSVTAQFNPKHQLTLSVPLSYIGTQNESDAYQVGVGLAYRYNINENWSLTPAITYAYRSFDNQRNQFINPLSSTELIGGSITNKYTWNLQSNALKVSLINMIGYFESLDSNNTARASWNTGVPGLCSGGVCTGAAINGTVSNYVIKNGLHATKNMGNFNVGAYFTDTEYFGSSLYLEQFNEIGFSFKPQNISQYLDALSVDANYLFSLGGKHSNELDGFRLNLNYKY